MSNDDQLAREAARILIEIEAVLFRPHDPFTFTSGRKSPVYVDCRRIIGFPEARSRLMDMMVDQIRATAGDLDAVAGGETAGIPFAAFVAERMNLPMLYVRKQPKGFGRGARIEGYFEPGQRVALIEDLATDGGSKMSFVEGLREAEMTCASTYVVFHYGIFPEAIAKLREQGVELYGLTTWWETLAEAGARGYLDEAGVAGVKQFLEDPDGWAAANA
ncbi:MAG: orotate phosphoribosyltransferase [Alphaproteobacteria bacterium]